MVVFYNELKCTGWSLSFDWSSRSNWIIAIASFFGTGTSDKKLFVSKRLHLSNVFPRYKCQKSPPSKFSRIPVKPNPWLYFPSLFGRRFSQESASSDWNFSSSPFWLLPKFDSNNEPVLAKLFLDLQFQNCLVVPVLPVLKLWLHFLSLFHTKFSSGCAFTIGSSSGSYSLEEASVVVPILYALSETVYYRQFQYCV